MPIPNTLTTIRVNTIMDLNTPLCFFLFLFNSRITTWTYSCFFTDCFPTFRTSYQSHSNILFSSYSSKYPFCWQTRCILSAKIDLDFLFLSILQFFFSMYISRTSVHKKLSLQKSTFFELWQLFY